MHRADRRRGQVVEHEVAVGDRVDRVGGGPRETELGGAALAIELPVQPGERPRAQRHRHGRAPGEARSGSRRARASRNRPAGGGPDRRAARVAGACIRASASRGEPRRAPAADPSARRSAPEPRSARSRTYSAVSVATWSLRERAVWSLPPSGPRISVTRRSIAMWMSSSPSANSNSPRSSSVATVSRAPSRAPSSSSVSTPASRRARACAREPRMSWGQRRLIEADRRVQPVEQRVGRIAKARHAGQFMERIG